MKKIVIGAIVAIVLLAVLAVGGYGFVRHLIGHALESAAKELPPIQRHIGNVQGVEGVRLSEYKAESGDQGGERFVCTVVGSRGSVLMAADVTLGTGLVDRVAICAQNGELIARMDNVADTHDGLHCQ